MPYVEPGLLAGWEPDAPAGDSLLRRFLMNWQAWYGSLCREGLRRDDLVAANLGRPAGFLHGAVLLAPVDRDSVDGLLRAINAYYDGPPVGEVLLFSPWPTPDLRPYGWRLEGHPPLMLRPVGAGKASRGTDLRIEEVHDAEGLREFWRVVVTGYPLDGVDPDRAVLEDAMLRDGRMRCWIGRREDRAVSAVSVFTDVGVHHVTVVATLPEARGRGFGEALMWEPTLADPAFPAMLLSSDLGRPVYQRMGYLPLLRFTVWSRHFDGNH